MRTILRPILFLGFIQILRVESVARQDTTEATPVTTTKSSSRYRDPLLAKIWPNRTMPTNEDRIKALAIALQNADKVLNGKRIRKHELSEKPRMFGSPIMAPELRPRSDDGPADPPRRNVRLRARPTGRYSTPSSVLLPPYKSYTPEFNFNNDKTVQSSSSKSLTKENAVRDFVDNSTVGRAKIYELTSAYPLRNDLKNSSAQRGPEENNVRRYFIPQSNKHTFGDRREYSLSSFKKTETTFPPYWDTTTSEPLKIRLNTSAAVEAAEGRGPSNYNHYADDNEITKQKDLLSSEESGYHWGRRPVQTVNHYKFVDTAWKVSSIPGVPGQDYPVHQHHVHNHLRYHSSRFLCPTGPGTHVYLADRASRCQMFYVCYGEKTGVPMMCPNGTLFSEHLQVCDWWFNVSC